MKKTFSFPKLLLCCIILYFIKNTVCMDNIINKDCLNSTFKNEIILASNKTLQQCNKFIAEIANSNDDNNIDFDNDNDIDYGYDIKINIITQKIKNLFELVKNYKKVFNNHKNNSKNNFIPDKEYFNSCILFNEIKILSNDIQKFCS